MIEPSTSEILIIGAVSIMCLIGVGLVVYFGFTWIIKEPSNIWRWIVVVSACVLGPIGLYAMGGERSDFLFWAGVLLAWGLCLVYVVKNFAYGPKPARVLVIILVVFFSLPGAIGAAIVASSFRPRPRKQFPIRVAE